MGRQPIRIENAFTDPHEVRALVERNGPYRTVASYLPMSATQGRSEAVCDSGTLPWFRGAWAANGEPLVDGAKAILDNPRFREG